MMTKVQLREAVARFVADENRIVSVKNLCEIAGISFSLFRDVFTNESRPLSPVTQIRMERALESLKRGEVKITRTHGRNLAVSYRRKPQPEFGRSMGLTMKNGRIALKVGLRNVNDYTQPTFKEELER